jgi:hypothetical protein
MIYESLHNTSTRPIKQFVAQLRAMLAEAEFNALWADGRAMTMEQAIELALNAS